MKTYAHRLPADTLTRPLAILMLTLAAIAFALRTKAASFADMSLAEVTTLIDDAKTASAKEAVGNASENSELPPVEVTVGDLMGKVYGVVPADCSKRQCLAETAGMLRLSPEEDEGVFWLESDGGYRLSYYGQTPEVSAMARFAGGDDSRVSDYGYFFLFPYAEDTREADAARQIDFCSTLLQEMHDMGLEPGVNVMSDDLFEVMADYDGASVDVRLLDDTAAGRYILILAIEP